jgi:hypothetical protein
VASLGTKILAVGGVSLSELEKSTLQSLIDALISKSQSSSASLSNSYEPRRYGESCHAEIYYCAMVEGFVLIGH